jgi:hypothetical protein
MLPVSLYCLHPVSSVPRFARGVFLLPL